MVKVIITDDLYREVDKKFKSESEKAFHHMKTLEQAPQKGKALGHIENIIIKEFKYKTYRFYFITDGHVLRFGTEEELLELLIKFVRMSEKKDQQKTINEIKNVLTSLGFEGF